jgi:hypothetical protein
MAVVAALALLAAAGAANAQQVAAGDAADDEPFFGLDVGVKGGVGGNFLSEPDDPPPYTAPYDDGAGGVGGGVGGYVEFRALWGHLGLELGVLWNRNKNWCNIEYFNVLETDWITRFDTVRVPLLLEGSVENELVRGSLGIGPEFVVGKGSSTEIEVTDSPAGFDDSDLDAVRSEFRARDQADTFLCLGVGIAFKVWKLAISLDIRYAYNPQQPKAYDDRVQIDPMGNDLYRVTTIASNTMDLRILLGVAYEAKFGNF